MDREAILDGYQALKNHLEDSRPSQDIAPFGSGGSLIMSTPDSIAKVETSSHKEQFLVLIDVLLDHVVGTGGLKASIRRLASSTYNLATPAYLILSLFGNPEKEAWDSFDPAKIQLLEKQMLSGTLEDFLPSIVMLRGEAIVEQARNYLSWVHEFQERYQASQEFEKESGLLQDFIDQEDTP